MAKKISAVQRLVTFAMEVSEEELNQVLEVLAAIKASRFPVKKGTRTRKADKRSPALQAAIDDANNG